jgi:hypothetical protein
MPFGIGFRPRYFGDLVDRRPPVDWLEILSENFMAIGGRTRQMLLRLRADYPLVLHGVSLSIAGQDPLDPLHLARLRALADEVDPRFVTDHLTWTSWRGRESHDLLPVAYTEAVLAHVARRVDAVQAHLGRRLHLENPTVYVAFPGNEMDEAEFLAELCRRSGCGVLLDVNNLYVNAANLGCDPVRYLERLAPDCVAYFHVAGHAVLGDVRVDTHDEPVPDPVWALYQRACARFPGAGTVLERDDALPPFAELLAELARARALHAAAAAERAAPAAAPLAAPRRRGGGRAWAAVQDAFFAGVVGEAPAERVTALLAPTAPVPAARGLAVYRDAYLARLRRGIAQNFPTLRRVVGDAELERLVAAYVARHPPRGYEFARVTARLADYVPSHRFGADFGVASQVLADLAAFEQAELEVSEAPDDGPPLAAAALAEVPPDAWPRLRARCAAALRVVRCSADVLPAVDAVAAGRVPERPPPGATAYLIGRPGVELVRVRVPAEEAGVVERLLGGATIEAACAGVGIEAGATAVARLASLGLLRGLE